MTEQNRYGKVTPENLDEKLYELEGVTHHEVNQFLRASGMEVEGGKSEATWYWCREVGEHVEKWVKEEWRDREEKDEWGRIRREKAKELREREEALNRDRAALGLPPLMPKEGSRG